MNQHAGAADRIVRHFRQILLWPLKLVPIQKDQQIQKHWELLDQEADNPWRELSSEFHGNGTRFQRRHYNEFVTFLPHVQRFLYGEGLARQESAWHSESPVRVFRRNDVAKARVRLEPHQPVVTFDVGHVELYFFYDIDVLLLAVEVFADDLSLDTVQHMLYRFGRAYPTDWAADGTGSHCPDSVEWLSASGALLAASDYEKGDDYLAFVARYRSPNIASHWAALLAPLALHHSAATGRIRYLQIEYHRIPLMAYLALDDPRTLSRADFIRMGYAAAPGERDDPPYAERYLLRFERRHCYDRYWSSGDERLSTRFICTGPTLIVVGNAKQAMFTNTQTGILGQFRHQYFLLFLIAHFHRTALLMLSDRLVMALGSLEIQDADTVRDFKRNIRQIFENFLRFTHRYWFHDVSDQAQAQELFRMCTDNLGTEQLFNEVRQEIQDMSSYLDSDTLRRQSNSMIRLTVVTILGMILTVATGFLGMNLINATEASLALKVFYFAMVALPASLFAVYAVLKSRRLSDFLDALADERLPMRAKLVAFQNVFRKRARRVR